MLSGILLLTVFLLGLYFCLNYRSVQFLEGFSSRCPDVLIQDGDELILKNTKLADIPGVNPVRFKNLEEYTQFLEWQQSQDIHCPVLYFQKSYDPQNNALYQQRPSPMASVAAPHPDTDNPPYGMLTYPAMDPHNQDIGANTLLNDYFDVGEREVVSSNNAMDSNWGGLAQTAAAIEAGDYKGNYR
jgi:hypothetical protein